MRIHFIAIGGAAMHNLAIALKKNNWQITGSDDEIFEPSKSRLDKYGLLPEKMGWDAENIHEDLDLVILGMHARKDNIELARAKELELTIQSYPEFLFHQSKDKQRVVIAGSHGKTSTTSMILHVLQHVGKKFDFMVGAQIEGFETMVQLSDAPLIILEGDEYFSSPIDMKGKFLWYKPQIALITGIAWDHINVYPTLESYEKAFTDFIASIEENGKLIYFEGDSNLKIMAKFAPNTVQTIPYDSIEHEIKDGVTYIKDSEELREVQIFGEHNLQNLQGAFLICQSLGISDEDFFEAISSFTGAANRLEKLGENDKLRVFKDFAHSPSKLKATVSACKKQFSDEKLLAVMELHTFSSLDKEFLKQYDGSMLEADQAIVYYNPATIEHKKLKPISEDDVKAAFGQENLEIITESDELLKRIKEESKVHGTALLMTSGNFGGLDISQIAADILQ